MKKIQESKTFRSPRLKERNREAGIDVNQRNRIRPQDIATKEEVSGSVKLDQEVSEEFRDPLPNALEDKDTNKSNWSQPEDRGEDLINERDPFTQQPERDTQIPPELIQEHAFRLYEQRGGTPGDNLADWFEAERQLRQERNERKNTN